MCQYVGEHYAGDAACGVEEVGHEVASECGSAGGAQRCEPGGDIGLGEAVQHGVEHHRDGNDVEYPHRSGFDFAYYPKAMSDEAEQHKCSRCDGCATYFPLQGALHKASADE